MNTNKQEKLALNTLVCLPMGKWSELGMGMENEDKGNYQKKTCLLGEASYLIGFRERII